MNTNHSSRLSTTTLEALGLILEHSVLSSALSGGGLGTRARAFHFIGAVRDNLGGGQSNSTWLEHSYLSDLASQPQHWQLITSLEALYLTGPADDGVQKTLKDFGRGQELELDRDTKAGIAQ